MLKVLIDARHEGEIFAREAAGELIRQLSEKVFLGIEKEHSIAWRVKTAEAIKAKVKARYTDRVQTQVVNDFIGVRVLAGHSGCFVEIKNEINDWAKRFEMIEVKSEDHLHSPDESGYRAIHIDYLLSRPQDWGLPPEAGIELQLTTWLQHVHSMISHRLYYKSASLPDQEIPIFLNKLSAELNEIDERVTEFLKRQTESR